MVKISWYRIFKHGRERKAERKRGKEKNTFVYTSPSAPLPLPSRAVKRASMPGGSGSHLMCEGDTVILECRSNPHVVDIKFTQLRGGQVASIAKGKVKHELLVGQPFGTRFEMRGRDGIAPVTELDGGITEQILGELGGEGGEGGEGGAAAASDRDNRQLVDRSKLTHGRECSQKLGAEEIKELKDQGKDTKEVMKALIENSDTFKQKTEFSQAKWLRKKAAKHAPQFTTARPSALTLCRAYFRKEPFKIHHMREDTLARLLTLSNVQPGSRALVVDSMNGLVLGALAERMGGMGRLMHGFNGLQPATEALKWLNMDEERLKPIFHFPLSELTFVPHNKSAVAQVAPAAAAAEGKACDAMQEDAKDACSVPTAAAGAGEGTAEAASAEASSHAAPADAAAAGAGGEGGGTIEGRQRRIDGAKRVSQSFAQLTPHAPTVEETQAELQRGFDSMVIAGSLDVKLLVPPLLRLVKPSSPIVVYSPTPHPLVELQELLIREEVAMNLHISESWMREHQVHRGRPPIRLLTTARVLDARTHTPTHTHTRTHARTRTSTLTPCTPLMQTPCPDASLCNL